MDNVAIRMLDKHFEDPNVDSKLKLAYKLLKSRTQAYEHNMSFLVGQAKFMQDIASIYVSNPLFKKE